jgi:hypothetical protein
MGLISVHTFDSLLAKVRMPETMGVPSDMSGNTEGSRKERRWIVVSGGLLAVLLIVIVWGLVIPQVVPIETGERTGERSTSSVESAVKTTSRSEGAIHAVRCHGEQNDVWSCTVFFNDGRVSLVRAVWSKTERVLGVSVVHRFAP